MRRLLAILIDAWRQRRRARFHSVGAALLALLPTLIAPLPAHALELSEYQLKAAFLLNFIGFTEWPGEATAPLSICIYGEDPFGDEIDRLSANQPRPLTLRRTLSVRELGDCRLVFIARPAIGNLARVLDQLTGHPVLTVADSPDAARQGVILNLETVGAKVGFEANLAAARRQGLTLSSKLLRLASRVYQ